jgi:hypothetical protein
MARDTKPATVLVRMSPQLREGLKLSAQYAGCSLNSFVVQVLAAAAGHRVRFRGTAETGPSPEEQRDDLRSLDRDDRGRPEQWKERVRHRAAVQRFVDAILATEPGINVPRLLRWIDRTCPWHYVEWYEFSGPLLPAGLEPERLPGGASPPRRPSG